ncbi:hypothetical protein ASG76_02240 [Nocardioides sp. Soil774]|uniref:hypothetical protein n=1 Tax=Nocardioides sp. Soil774 TaxID=1736408 RepID=UPI0006FAB871|nr:hypothetical protein [Nocardioides sp. Soil774]KRE97549.1 hypothetical protein ASG76_02240 [Nocardioides sp. Soil774]
MIGQHGRQVMLINAAWIDGEQQLVVTWRDAEEIPLFCLHELIYSGGSLEESRYVNVAGEHLAELAVAVEHMRRVSDTYDR